MIIGRNERGSDKRPLEGARLENELEAIVTTWNNHDQGVQGFNKIAVVDGANKRMGVATLSAGAVTVNNTTVTANTRIFLSTTTAGGTVGHPYVSARSAGTSFTITSTSGTDTSTIAWLLIEPK